MENDEVFPLRQKKSLAVLLCIALVAVNIIGDSISVKLNLPIWLDTFGSMVAGFLLGPVYGGVVGFFSHIGICLKDGSDTYSYAIANALVGVIVATHKKNGWLQGPGGFSRCAINVTMISLLISIPNTFIFKDRWIGNRWGQEFSLILDSHFPDFVSITIGEFYVDFVDKVILLYALYWGVHLFSNKDRKLYHFRKMEIIDTIIILIVISSTILIRLDSVSNNVFFRVYMFVVGIMVVAWCGWLAATIFQHLELEKQQAEVEFLKQKQGIVKKMVLTLAHIVDARDKYTNMHSERVAKYSEMIGKRLGFNEENLIQLKRAAILHDIGKVGVSDTILNKNGKLTNEEYKTIQSHVVLGGRILEDFDFEPQIRIGAMNHHEKYDGSGYASKLKGEEIPLFGRIIGVADSFDAMTSDRVYRKKCTKEYVVSEFKRCRGTQFDPQICDIFLQMIESNELDHVFKTE